MSEWKTYKLEEICTDISYGYTESASSEMVGPKFLRITDIQHDFIKWDNVPYCPITQSNHKKYKLEVGDIVIARTGASTGATAIFKDVDIDAVYASYLIRYKIDKTKADPFYIGQVLKSPLWKQHVNSIIGGSGQPGANAKQFASFKIEIPDLPTQKEIAQILSSLDDKIELNLQMNQTLEAMAQAIFKEWFVNFNFPGFDGELVDGLPRGWRRGKLGEEFNLIMGQSPLGTSYNEIGEGMVFYQGRTDFGFRFPTNRLYTTEPKRIAKTLDTLVSVRAPVGDVNMANEMCCVGRGLSSVRHKTNAYSYTYYVMKNAEPVFKGFEGEGTVFGSINKSNFESIEIIVPSDEIISEFETVINPIDDKILENTKQIRSLTQTRDTLLPKLMSGQIEIEK